jgi:uncharacterized protein
MGVYSKPLPVVTDDNRQYWEYCKKHELRMQKCTQCGCIRFPAGFLCPQCHSLEADWIKISGLGKIYSYVVFRTAYHPAYQNDIPYVVGLIRLAEGPQMESNIVGCRVEDVKIDMPVQVVFDDVTDSVSLPKFKPIN